MSDAITKARALEARARANRQTDRARAWYRIQQEACDLAVALKELAAVFGKPAELRVDLKGERVYPVGRSDRLSEGYAVVYRSDRGKYVGEGTDV